MRSPASGSGGGEHLVGGGPAGQDADTGHKGDPGAGPAPGPAYTFDVFVSYSRTDIAFARRLEKTLENYRPPAGMPDPLEPGRPADRSPRRRLRVFRDEADITGTDYAESIQQHLGASAKLVVVCSPQSRASEFVNDEIRRFAASHAPGDIIPVWLSGIPDNEATPDQGEQRAFPQALLEVSDMPLALDYRSSDGDTSKLDRGIHRNAWYGLLANVYGVSRSEIEQRDEKRKQRERNTTIAVVGTVMVALSGLTVFAFQQRGDAIDSREIADAQRDTALTRLTQVRANALVVAAQAEADPLLQALILGEAAEQDLPEPAGGVAVAIAARDALNAPSNTVVDIGWDHAPHPGRVGGEPLVDASGIRLSGGGWAFQGASPEGAYSFPQWQEDRRIPTAAWLSDDGTWGAAGHADGTLELAGIALRTSTVAAGRGPISALAFSPDGSAVASAGLDGSVYVWEKPGPEHEVVPAEGEAMEAHAPLASFAHSAPVHTVAWGGGSHPVVTGSEDGQVRAWNPSAPEMPIELLRLDAPALSVAATPDGRVVAAGGADGSVRLLWGEGVGDAAGDPSRAVDLHDGEDPVQALAVTPDGSVVVGMAAGRVWFWSSDGRHVRTEDMGHSDRPPDVFTVRAPAAIRLDWRGRFVQVRRPDDSQLQRWPLQVPVPSLLDSIPGATGARFLAGGGVAVGLPEGGVRTYSLDGERAEAVVGLDPAEPGPPSPAVSGVATSRGGRWRAQVVGTEVRLTAPGDSVATPLVHDHEIGQIAFSEDGSRLLAMPRDGLYAPATIWALGPPPSSSWFSFSADRGTLPDDEPESEWVNPTNRGGLNADGSMVWTAVSEQEGRRWHVVVRPVETLEPVADDYYYRIACVSLSPDGRWALVCHEDIEFRSALHLWDLATGARRDLSGAGHPCCWEATQPLGGDFSPDGARLLTWAEDGSAVLHRLDVPADAQVVNGADASTAPGESRPALVGARMSQDQQLAVTVSQDGKIQLWPLGWESLVRELRDRSVACLTASERVRLLAEPLATADSAQAACGARYRR